MKYDNYKCTKELTNNKPIDPPITPNTIYNHPIQMWLVVTRIPQLTLIQ